MNNVLHCIKIGNLGFCGVIPIMKWYVETWGQVHPYKLLVFVTSMSGCKRTSNMWMTFFNVLITWEWKSRNEQISSFTYKTLFPAPVSRWRSTSVMWMTWYSGWMTYVSNSSQTHRSAPCQTPPKHSLTSSR